MTEDDVNEALKNSKNAIEGAFEGSITEAENLVESIYGGKCLTDSNCSAVSFCDGNHTLSSTYILFY